LGIVGRQVTYLIVALTPTEDHKLLKVKGSQMTGAWIGSHNFEAKLAHHITKGGQGLGIVSQQVSPESIPLALD
jgi:hypothetical protein